MKIYSYRHYKFGPSIVRWISLFQKGAESSTIENGFISDFFLFKAGLKTSRPNVPLNFYFMCLTLRKNNKNRNDIHVIKKDNKE